MNRNTVTDVRYFWDAVKGFIHNKTTAFVPACNKCSTEQALLIEEQQKKPKMNSMYTQWAQRVFGSQSKTN